MRLDEPRIVIAGIAIAASLFTAGQAHAQCEQAKLIASDAAEKDTFGHAVSVDGDYAVVGAVLDDHPDFDEGAVYVFHRETEGWTQQAKLFGSDTARQDNFGSSVSISGDNLLIGATGAHWHSGLPYGAVYFFRRDGDTWIEELRVDDGSRDHAFGCSSALAGDVAIIGAQYDDEACGGSQYCNAGAAHIYRWNEGSWAHEQKLMVDDWIQHYRFGSSVATDGTVAVVGARRDETPELHSGSAYVFRWDGVEWVEEAKLTASDGQAYAQLGISVSVSGDYVVVGAWGDQEMGPWSGAAYVFYWDGGTWVEQAKLTPIGASPGDDFGYSVSIQGDYIAVGAMADNAAACTGGAAYVFKRSGTTWSQLARVTAADAGATDRFGSSVSLDWPTLLVGALGDQDDGRDTGSAYLHTMTDECGDNGTTDQCPTGVGDQVLYAYEGDVPPYDPSAGWSLVNACDPPYCTESVEDGRFVLTWAPSSGDFVYYIYYTADSTDELPPTLWVEWRFRSDLPFPPTSIGCDGKWHIQHDHFSTGVEMHGDAVFWGDNSENVLGLDVDELHTYRLEARDGLNYQFSADGIVFSRHIGQGAVGLNVMQIFGEADCPRDPGASQTNEWDYMRYGTIGDGESIVSSDPPSGQLSTNRYASLDRFSVTFGQPNYAYIDDITVEVEGAKGQRDEGTESKSFDIPQVVKTWRLDHHGPETFEVVLDRPLTVGETTTFTFNTAAQGADTIEYTLAEPVPASSDWTIAVTCLLLLTAATIVVRQRTDDTLIALLTSSADRL